MSHKNYNIESFLQDFFKEKGMDPKTKYRDVFQFELTKYWANELLRLVLEGR